MSDLNAKFSIDDNSINKLTQAMGQYVAGAQKVTKAQKEVSESQKKINEETKKTKNQNISKEINNITSSLTKMTSVMDSLKKSLTSFQSTTQSTLKTTVSDVKKILSEFNLEAKAVEAQAKKTSEQQTRASSLARRWFSDDKLTEAEYDQIDDLATAWKKAEITASEFYNEIQKINKEYAKQLAKNDEIAAKSKNEIDLLNKQKAINAAITKASGMNDRRKAEAAEIEARTARAQKESLYNAIKQQKIDEENLKTLKEINAEKTRKESAKATEAEEKAAQQHAKAVKEEAKTSIYLYTEKEKAAAAELRRQIKLIQNDKAREAVYNRLRSVINGENAGLTETDRKAQIAVVRLKETMQNLAAYAATKGYNGTSGLESTSYLRVQQYAKQISAAAIEWKLVNSQEGKAAQLVESMSNGLKKFRKGVSVAHTMLGQVASALGAIRGIGQTIRKSFQQIAQYVTQSVTQLTSSSFSSALDALKDLELSEIGFANFFGEEEVSGIVSNIKQQALTSPLSATQLADYVNQLAPLSNGNSTLATNAAMGVAKMIQYSGGDVSSEMSYVIRNLRDVMSKGSATTLDIRQFNRAMPALEQVLKEMGLTEFLDESESTLEITAENAKQMLEAFNAINSADGVGDIFDQTSTTLSGLMERMEEQIQLLIIDVGEFSGLTDLIKNTLNDLLEDTSGWIEDIKMSLNFFFYDVTRWLKSRDWDRILETAKELFNIFKTGISDAFNGLKQALGGVDVASTLKSLASALTSFIEGIINSYSWLINIVKTLNNSGIIGSSLVQSGMSIMGFMSGGAGALITGLMRGLDNLLGVVNQLTLALIEFSLKNISDNLTAAASTLSSFSEALSIVTRIMPDLAEEIAVINQMYSGQITTEEATNKMKLLTAKSETAASDLVVKAKEAEAAASNKAATADNTEAASSGSFGLLSTIITKGMGTFGKILGTVSISTLASSLLSGLSEKLSEAFGSDDLTSSNVSSGVGNISSGVLSGAGIGATVGSLFGMTGIGAAAGSVIGLLGGIFGTVSSIQENQEEQNAAELQALEEEIDSGDYVRDIVEEYGKGTLRLTEDEFDEINSKFVKEMNQFNETFPNGTAEMLKEYLKSIESELYTNNGILMTADKEREEQASELWTLIEAGEIERANNYAEGLYSSGLSTADVTSMILQKAAEAWAGDENISEKLKDLVLQWSDVQDEEGNDLTYTLLESLKSGSAVDQAVFGDYRNQLKSLFLDMGEDLVANENLEDSEKKEIAKAFASGMTKWVTNAMEDMTAEEKASLTRLYTLSQIEYGGSTFGIDMSDTEWSSLVSGIDGIVDAIEKWGFNNNWTAYSSDYQGTENDFTFNDAGEALIEAQKNGEITIEEFWNTVEDDWTKYAKKTSESISETMAKYFELIAKTAEDSAVTAQASFAETVKANVALLPTITTSGVIDKASGGLIYKAAGGDIRGVDTVPAMLQQGEYVVRKSAVEKLGLTTMNALNTGNTEYFARALGRQNIYGDYSNARTWNTTSNDNRKSVRNTVKVYNNSKGARLNRYYSLANRLV